MRKTPLHISLKYALDGIGDAVKTEANIRVHMCSGVLVLLLAEAFELETHLRVILLGFIALIIGMELMNTAVESVVDMVSREYNPLAKRAKDAAAGATLACSLLGFAAGVVIFLPKAGAFWEIIKSAGGTWFTLISGLIFLSAGVILIIARSARGKAGWFSLICALVGALCSAILACRFSVMTLIYSAVSIVLALYARLKNSQRSAGEVLAGFLVGAGIALIALYCL